MGLLKTSDYKSERMGITIPMAYAKIVYVNIDNNGNATATFCIQQTRENTTTKEPLDIVQFSTMIDKNIPVFEQIYTSAKNSTFIGWEDDIVEEEIPVEDTTNEAVEDDESVIEDVEEAISEEDE